MNQHHLGSNKHINITLGVTLGAVIIGMGGLLGCEKSLDSRPGPNDSELFTVSWTGQGDGESWSDPSNWSKDFPSAELLVIHDAEVIADVDSFIASKVKIEMVNASIQIARGRLMVNKGEILLSNSAINTARGAWFRNEGRVEGTGTVTLDCPDGGSAVGLTGDGIAVTELDCLVGGGCRDFTFGVIQGGEEMTSQFMSFIVSAENGHHAHPDKVIGFDSNMPTGGDTDLMTPGTGQGNTTAQCTVLIIAENDVDANGDGLVDDPDDEACGGKITFEFNGRYTVESIALLDIEEAGAVVKLYDGDERVHVEPAAQLDDNSLQRLDLTGTPAATRLVVKLPGSGAIDDLRICPVP